MMGPLEKKIFDLCYDRFRTQDELAEITGLHTDDVGVFILHLSREFLLLGCMTRDYRKMRWTANRKLHDAETLEMSKEQERKKIEARDARRMVSSWRIGAERDWDCDFYPQRNGCECAGGGLTEEECRNCFYRSPIGEKNQTN